MNVWINSGSIDKEELRVIRLLKGIQPILESDILSGSKLGTNKFKNRVTMMLKLRKLAMNMQDIIRAMDQNKIPEGCYQLTLETVSTLNEIIKWNSELPLDERVEERIIQKISELIISSHKV